MIGRTWSVIAPLDRPDEMPAVFERIRNGESVDQYQAVRRTKSGLRNRRCHHGVARL